MHKLGGPAAGAAVNPRACTAPAGRGQTTEGAGAKGPAGRDGERMPGVATAGCTNPRSREGEGGPDDDAGPGASPVEGSREGTTGSGIGLALGQSFPHS